MACIRLFGKILKMHSCHIPCIQWIEMKLNKNITRKLNFEPVKIYFVNNMSKVWKWFQRVKELCCQLVLHFFAPSCKLCYWNKSVSVTTTASVRKPTMQATWALLFWPTWTTSSVCKPTTFVVTERGCRLWNYYLVIPRFARFAYRSHQKIYLQSTTLHWGNLIFVF